MFCCFGCLTSRKTLLAADGGGPVAAPHAAATPIARAGERWLDIHCHVYNVLDIPAARFVDTVRLYLAEEILAFEWVALIVGWLRSTAPTALAEAKALDDSRAEAILAAWSTTRRSTEAALRLLVDPPARQVGDAVGAGGEPAPDPNDPRRGTALPEIPPGSDAFVREALVERGLRPPELLSAPVTEADIRDLAQAIDDDPVVQRFVRWASRFGGARTPILADLLDQYGDATVMLAPAMVDLSRWLGLSRADDGITQTVPDQLQAMRAIARRRANPRAAPGGTRPPGVPVISFVPFCPWRHLEDVADGRETLLDLLADPTKRGGVAGVKLYPPMGFWPLGNAGRPAGTFPPALYRAVAHGCDPGEALDRAMTGLFEFCAEHALPIMAHCGDSNYPKAGYHYGDRAGPDGWARVLERAEFSGLRINLAHFGGVWNFADPTGQSGDVAEARTKARRWAEQIAKLVDAYENLYVDLGFCDQILGNPCVPGSACAQTVAFLSDLFRDHPKLLKRVMHGTDWQMVGISRDGDRYVEFVRRNLATLFPGDAIEDFRWRNAARYLGLRAGSARHSEIEAFMRSIGARPALLAGFDPGP